MPPKTKVTKEMILSAVLEITKKNGFLSVNARSIAAEIQCSTRPIFTCYANMEQLKADFLRFAFDYYSEYVENYRKRAACKPYLVFPLSYLEFAEQETHLFHLLFIYDMQLNMRQASDFYHDVGNEKKAEEFARQLQVSIEKGKRIFLDLFLYTHGMAVLTATKKLTFQPQYCEEMLESFHSALLQSEGRCDR